MRMALREEPSREGRLPSVHLSELTELLAAFWGPPGLGWVHSAPSRLKMFDLIAKQNAFEKLGYYP